MKKIVLLLTAFTISLSILAQGNSDNKGKGKDKSATEKSKGNDKAKGKDKADKDKADKEKKEKADHDSKIWEGTSDKGGGGPKASKNQPAKVRQAFQRDYPNATNVYWTKYRGDWTATFGNGVFRSTAVYHANGERKDTRTLVGRESLPKRVLDGIFKRRPETKVEEAVKIEQPKGIKGIFRIKDIINGQPQFTFYDEDGLVVKYDY
jgi:hypothetical protein